MLRRRTANYKRKKETRKEGLGSRREMRTGNGNGRTSREVGRKKGGKLGRITLRAKKERKHGGERATGKVPTAMKSTYHYYIHSHAFFNQLVEPLLQPPKFDVNLIYERSQIGAQRVYGYFGAGL